MRAVVWMHVFGNVDMRVRWCEYTYLIMLGYGHDESVPYVWRSVRTPFHGCTQRYRNPFAAVGVRFIVPVYPYSPTKWQTDMCVWWCGNAYFIMWKHVIDNVDMRVRWCECTYLVMRICIFDYVRIRAQWIGPLHLAECSHPISWVSVGISRNVCWYFAECFVCISLVFVGFSRCVRCIIADRQQHFRKPFAAVGVRFIAPAYTYSQQHWNHLKCFHRTFATC